MIPLPLSLVPSFERRLEETWWRRSSWAKRRDALCLGLGLCGLRWIEVSRVQVKDLCFEDGLVRVRTAKGGVDRVVAVGLSWVNAFRQVRYRLECSGILTAEMAGGVAFLSSTGRSLAYSQVLRTCRRWTKRHFGQAFTFHSLRHTAGVRLYLATRDVLAVQQLLGHKDLRWTQVYLQVFAGYGGVGVPSFVAGGSGDPGELRLFDPEGRLGADGRSAG